MAHNYFDLPFLSVERGVTRISVFRVGFSDDAPVMPQNVDQAHAVVTRMFEDWLQANRGHNLTWDDIIKEISGRNQFNLHKQMTYHGIKLVDVLTDITTSRVFAHSEGICR